MASSRLSFSRTSAIHHATGVTNVTSSFAGKSRLLRTAGSSLGLEKCFRKKILRRANFLDPKLGYYDLLRNPDKR
jgi:hypothetical protein